MKNRYNRQLAGLLKSNHTTVTAARVSSAQAHGAAKQYSYWGATTYSVRLGSRGDAIALANRAADSDRRSRRLAEQDAESLCDGLVITSIGHVSEGDAIAIVAHYWPTVTIRTEQSAPQPPSLSQRLQAHKLHILRQMGVQL